MKNKSMQTSKHRESPTWQARDESFNILQQSSRKTSSPGVSVCLCHKGFEIHDGVLISETAAVQDKTVFHLESSFNRL